MTQREQHTYCRICEPMCGLVATVEDGRLVSVRPDADHVHSQGFCCTKAQGMVEVTYDEDRLRTPMRRVGGPGEFAPVSWDDALDDVTARLSAIRREHGRAALATFFGNPPAFSYSAMLAISGFQEALDVRWRYGVNAEDGASRTVANHLLYGSVVNMALPDLWRTSFALVIGANPLVSHGSMVSEPRFREMLDSVVQRGGRVVVVDPRHTQTARRYEHVGVRAGTDAWFLLGLLHVLVRDDLVDRAFLAEHTTGFDELAELVRPFDPTRCAAACGVPADQLTALAHAFAAAPGAVVYGRTGTCTQQFGTLNNVLQDTLSIVTGNLEREGGLVQGWGIVDFAKFAELGGLATYGKFRSRTTGQPDVVGMLPSTSLPTDISTPGPGQVRALVSVGCNPVLTSAGGGPPLEAALEELDLHVSLDLYMNETNKHADYLLPVCGMFEREDIPLIGLGLMLRPSVWATDAVIDPVAETRSEWWILDELARRQGAGGAYQVAPLRWMAKAGLRVSPRRIADLLLRTSRAGDWFGLRPGGISFAKLVEREPSGRLVREDVPVQSLRRWLKTKDHRVHLMGPEVRSELARLADTPADPDFPLRAIGMREVRSHNSWMHNVERLMPDARRHEVLVHPEDAAAAGLRDGDQASVTSATTTIEVQISVTDEMVAGTIAIPHGWGHAGGWQRANRAGGRSSNLLASGDNADLEALAGMSVLNGIPIRLGPTSTVSR